MSTTPPLSAAQEEVAGLSVRELLEILGLHAPVQRGTIQGRVQRRLDALPVTHTHDREVVKAIGARLLEYMQTHNLTTILLNEDSQDYTSIQDTGSQVSQNPTRFFGAPSYPQQIVAGDINPIRRRVMTKTLIVDSSFRQQYVAGDGIQACAQLGCTDDADDCCSCAFPSNSVVSCFQAPAEVNCIPPGSNVQQDGGVVNSAGPATNWQWWHGEPSGRYTEAFRNQYLNCLPNAGEGVVLPCRLYTEPAGNYSFDLQRSTIKVLSMTLTSIQLPAAAVYTVPQPDPDQYLAGPGLHNLQCVYATPEELQTVSKLDPRTTIWLIDETLDAVTGPTYCVHPLVIPAGHYSDTFAIAQAITTAWQRLCQTATAAGDCTLIGKEGAFRADGVRAAYAYEAGNQVAPFAISPAHTSGHVALSVPTAHIPDPETHPWLFSIWFVPPPMTADGYLDVQARGTAEDDCTAFATFDTEVCPPSNSWPDTAQPWVSNAETGETEFHGQPFKGAAATGGTPGIPPVLRGRKPQVYKAMPGSLGWVLGYRVAQLSVADFASAPQPNPSFYQGGGASGLQPSPPTPGAVRSVLIGSSPYQSCPPYLFLRIDDHNNNYYAAVEGIAGESVMPPDTLAILEHTPHPGVGVVPSGLAVDAPVLQQQNSGRYTLSPGVPYKREYFGAADIAKIRAALMDSNRNVSDLGQNNYSFTLTFETLYNL